MKISVIIPTRNEPFINDLVKKLNQELNEVDCEIIIVDKSNTPPAVENVKLVFQKSTGLGNAVIEGLGHAKGDVIVLMDGDGSHRPEDVPKLLQKIDDYDIMIGSRFISGGETRDKTHRKIISWMYRKFTSFLLDLPVEDPMSGFSAVKRKVYDSLKLRPLGYKINMEIMFKTKKKRFKVCEVPIVFLERKAGKPKSGVREAFRILRYIFELKLGLR